MAKQDSSKPHITRLSASSADDGKKLAATKVAAEKKPSKIKALKVNTTKRRNPPRATRDYFVGAWQELRQVHWPNRRATWGLTLAVLLFSGFFVALILLLDAGFKYLFELLLG